MKYTLNELGKILKSDNNNSGDYSFYGVVSSTITDEDDKVIGYNVTVGDSTIETRKLAGADVGDVVLCTTLSNGITVISGTLDGDKDAVHAGELAEETNNYFWFTSTDTGFGRGAHITEKPQLEVLDDPTNAGGNVLIDSDSLDIRDGENVLATFSAEETRVGSYENSNIVLSNRGIVAKKSDGSEYFNVGIIGNEQQYISQTASSYGGSSSITRYLSGPGAMEEFKNLYDAIADGGAFRLRAEWTIYYRGSSTDTDYRYTARKACTYSHFAKGTSYTYRTTYQDLTEMQVAYHSGSNAYIDCYINPRVLNIDFPHGWRLNSVFFTISAYVNTTAPAYSFGINTDVSKKLGFAIGNGTAPSECGFACGKYNEVDNDDEYALIVGNGDENSPSNAMTVSWDGDLAISGKHQALYKITTVAVETGSIDADSYKSSQNYPMTEVDGYNAVGIVGWSTSNWRIQPTSHYISSNTQLYAGFANYKSPPSSGTSSASATITFRVLWLKATSA